MKPIQSMLETLRVKIFLRTLWAPLPISYQKAHKCPQRLSWRSAKSSCSRMTLSKDFFTKGTNSFTYGDAYFFSFTFSLLIFVHCKFFRWVFSILFEHHRSIQALQEILARPEHPTTNNFVNYSNLSRALT